jgi:hypothetical protein
MKSVVEVEINVPEQELADLFADPRNKEELLKGNSFET